MNLAAARLLILLLIMLFSGAAFARRDGGAKNNKEAGKLHQFFGGMKGAVFSETNKSDKESSANSQLVPAQSLPGKKQAISNKARLSPEERRALRQQIHDVEQELHSSKK